MANFVLDPVMARMDQVVEFGPGERVPRRGNRLSRTLAIVLLALFGWRVSGELPNIPKFLIIGAPHTSNWDMAVAMLGMFALGLRLSFMGKHSLFRWPVGGVMRWFGGVPVWRHAPQGLVGQMIDAFAQREQFILAILPEGTRRRVSQWKLGFYHIAVGAGVPLVMVKFDYGRKVLEFGPVFHPSGNLEGDLPQIQANFKEVRGKYPQNDSLSNHKE